MLGIFADGLTTDHVSPGGEIPPDSPAGIFLKAGGILPADFNTYVGRRGNHEVMARGTYANLRIRNALVPEREGWWTASIPEDEIISYSRSGEPLCRSRGAADRARGSGLRRGQQPRLGGQGPCPARRRGGDCGLVRADTSLKPHRGRHPAARLPRRADRRKSRPGRR